MEEEDRAAASRASNFCRRVDSVPPPPVAFDVPTTEEAFEATADIAANFSRYSPTNFACNLAAKSVVPFFPPPFDPARVPALDSPLEPTIESTGGGGEIGVTGLTTVVDSSGRSRFAAPKMESAGPVCVDVERGGEGEKGRGGGEGDRATIDGEREWIGEREREGGRGMDRERERERRGGVLDLERERERDLERF